MTKPRFSKQLKRLWLVTTGVAMVTTGVVAPWVPGPEPIPLTMPGDASVALPGSGPYRVTYGQEVKLEGRNFDDLGCSLTHTDGKAVRHWASDAPPEFVGFRVLRPTTEARLLLRFSCPRSKWPAAVGPVAMQVHHLDPHGRILVFLGGVSLVGMGLLILLVTRPGEKRTLVRRPAPPPAARS